MEFLYFFQDVSRYQGVAVKSIKKKFLNLLIKIIYHDFFSFVHSFTT